MNKLLALGSVLALTLGLATQPASASPLLAGPMQAGSPAAQPPNGFPGAGSPFDPETSTISPIAGIGAGFLPASGSITDTDLTDWKYWWFFNREDLLDLRRRFDEIGLVTGQIVGKPIPTRPSDAVLQRTVLPTLFEMAEKNQQDNMRLGSSLAIARIATPESDRILETLEGLITSEDPSLREASTLALGIDGNPKVIEILTTILDAGKPARKLLGSKPNDRMRAFAAYGLATLADRAANDDIRRVALRPVLTHFLDTKERADLRVALASALGMMRIEFAPSGAPELPLGKSTMPRYRDGLIDILWKAYENEREELVRGHLPLALARLLTDAPDPIREAGIKRFMALLDKNPQPWEIWGLVSALGVVGDAWGRPEDRKLRRVLYTQAVKQSDSHGRHLAFIALAEVVANSGPSLPPASVQKELEDFLLKNLEGGRQTDRPWVAMASGVFGSRLRMPVPGRKGARAKGRVGEALIGGLRKMVRSGDSPDEFSAAALALGLTEDQTAANDVEDLLDRTGIKEVRGFAALSLGLLGRTSTFDKLAKLLYTLRLEPASLEHAAIGLVLLDRTRGSKLLSDELAAARSGITAAPLAAAIGRVSDNSVVLRLSALARNQEATLATRQNAGTALGMISDRYRLSWRSSLADNINYAAWTPTLFDVDGRGVFNLF